MQRRDDSRPPAEVWISFRQRQTCNKKKGTGEINTDHMLKTDAVHCTAKLRKENNACMSSLSVDNVQLCLIERFLEVAKPEIIISLC